MLFFTVSVTVAFDTLDLCLSLSRAAARALALAPAAFVAAALLLLLILMLLAGDADATVEEAVAVNTCILSLDVHISLSFSLNTEADADVEDLLARLVAMVTTEAVPVCSDVLVPPAAVAAVSTVVLLLLVLEDWDWDWVGWVDCFGFNMSISLPLAFVPLATTLAENAFTRPRKEDTSSLTGVGLGLGLGDDGEGAVGRDITDVGAAGAEDKVGLGVRVTVGKSDIM